ncbi:MAG: DNA polymerase III subunit gamma/tau [Oligoflexia bacterium]|nr:DNA polymerase III subunit gamma/tau [Oligoflexia bacterium]
MSYQVLARKWRPQSFEELVGQEHVATTLLNALKSSRMPHALLFTGARGVGKTSAARILAKSLRCPKAKDFVPCNECHDCQEITAGRSIDVIEVDGASNNGVENIRELRETVGYMPSTGKYKVYIIDEVHMLSTSAFNALLKTLEEPPPHVIFIFATTEPQKIPVTILSRCQRFDFRRIPVRKVVDRLKTIIEAEGVEAEPQALWLLARESEGSMRDSQSLLDQVITFCGTKVTHTQVVEVLGLTDRTLLSTSLRALVDRNAASCLQIIERVFHQGYDPKQFAQDLLEHLRNLMIVKVSVASGNTTSTGEFLDLPDQEIDELKKYADELSNEDVHMLFDMTLKGVGDVLRAQDPRIVLEMLLLRLSQAPRLTSIEKLIASIENGGSKNPTAVSTKPVIPATPTRTPLRSEAPVQTATPVRAAAAPTVAVASGGSDLERWAELVGIIKKEKPLLGAKLEYAFLQNLEGENLVIGFRKEQEFFYNQVAQKEVVNQIVDVVAKHWGRKYKVQVTLSQGSPNQSSPKEAREAAETAVNDRIREQVESHPLVREAKDVFKARITSIKESQ